MSNCSVLIVNWNSWEHLTRCLKQLSSQTFSDFKVYVADNASDLPAPEEIFRLFPELVFFKNNENYGFAEANNHLLEQVKDSEWVVLLNPDAYPEPEWLEQLIIASKHYTEYSFFASQQLMAEAPNRLDGLGDVYHVSGLAWRAGYGKSVSRDCAAKEVFSPCAAAAMYRTKKILEVGGFDKDFFCYFEDVDLGFRLRLIGERCLLVPTAVVHHYGSATSGRKGSDFSVYYGHRNLVWTYVKNMPGLLFWLFLPHHLLLNCFSIIYFIMIGQGRVILKAKIDALAAVPKMWGKRSQIQATRSVKLTELIKVMDISLIPRLRNLLRSI